MIPTKGIAVPVCGGPDAHSSTPRSHRVGQRPVVDIDHLRADL